MTNWEKFDDLDAKIQEFRKSLPTLANQIPTEQFEKLCSMYDERDSYIDLIKDKSRRP